MERADTEAKPAAQIWFQNRRQSSRRKNKPLGPDEVLAYQNSFSVPPSVYSPAPPESQPSSHPASAASRAGEGFAEELSAAASVGQDARPTGVSSTPGVAKDEGSFSIPQGSQQSVSAIDPVSRPEESGSQPFPSSQESRGPLGYLANRRSAADPRPSQEDMNPPAIPSSQPEADGSAKRPLNKTPSMVRLSMTSDGNAKIVTGSDSSPSPPRKMAPPTPYQDSPQGLYRSYSATSLADLGSSQGSNASLRRKASGRSRDSRAWEFWCDKDARSELEEKANQERSGSAADAIGLMRSNSARSALRSLPGKRNLQFASTPQSAKRLKTGMEEPTPQHTSPYGWQPAKRILGERMPGATPGRLGKTPSKSTVEVPATDSDKENWSPERAIMHTHVRGNIVATPGRLVTPARPDRRGPVMSVERTALRNAKALSKLSSESTEVDDPEDDEEIAHFMGGRERKSDSVSEEEELDCVQGLLSLSQGNWGR